MPKLRLHRPDPLKYGLAVLKSLIDEPAIDILPAGFLQLKLKGFEHCRIDIQSLIPMLTKMNYSDIIIIKTKADGRTITFNVGSRKDNLSKYKMELMNIDGETLEISKPEYDAVIRMTTIEFGMLCYHIIHEGDGSAEISALEDGGTANISIRRRVDGTIFSFPIYSRSLKIEPKFDIVVEVKEPVASLTIPRSHLISFVKTYNMPDRVSLYLSSKLTSVFEFELGEMGFLSLHLDPQDKIKAQASPLNSESSD